MEYEIDVHTHTLASGHAYSTIQEMVMAAKDKGLKGVGITEHAPSMPGSCEDIYFRNLRVVPRQMYGVNVLLGVELNILNEQGDVDLPDYILRRLDVRIASVHRNVFPPSTGKVLMNSIEKALNNPYVDILGHPDDGHYEYDYKRLAELAAANNKIIEINNASLRPLGIRPNAYENDLKLLSYCKDRKVNIIVGSDAHVSFDVGAHEEAVKVLNEADYPDELILNYHMDKLLAILEEHKMEWADK